MAIIGEKSREKELAGGAGLAEARERKHMQHFGLTVANLNAT